VEKAIEYSEAANVLHLPARENRRKRERRKQEHHTTIAIGMRVKDGIVIAADRLLSSASYQYEEDKLSLYPINNGFLFFAYADSPVLAKEIRQKIETAVDSSGDVLTCEDMQGVVEGVINEVSVSRLSMPLEMLVACSLEGQKAQMWLYRGGEGFNVAGQFEILGVGNSSLIRYLEKTYHWHDSLDKAQDVAIYLVHQAGQFIPGCRGIDALWVGNKGEFGFLDKQEIAEKLQPMIAREDVVLRTIITGSLL
jgi:20S proteasome alpha/beta subunit